MKTLNVAMFLIALISLVPSCGSSVEEAESTINVSFLSKAEGEVAILDETYEPYFSQLQYREIAAFVQDFPPSQDLDSARTFAREKFATAVAEFTTKEKSYISYTIKEVAKEFERQGNILFANHPWKLIKIENWLCGGFAHTRGDYIILSQKHLDHLSGDWKEGMTSEDSQALVSKLGGLLVHEQMHSLQRNYKSDFDSFYDNEWDYVRADVRPDSSIVLNQVSNPDAPLAEWLVRQGDDELYWIRTLLKATSKIPQMGKDFINKVYLVEKSSQGDYALKLDSEGSPLVTVMDSLVEFSSSFPSVAMRGIDHPNEVSAYMMSEYFVASYEKKEAFEDEEENSKEKTDAFIAWVSDFMHNHKKTKE